MTIRASRCLAILLLFISPYRTNAHNGRVALAYPVENITVDGDLSDWPEDLLRYLIASHPYREGSLENISGVQGAEDFEAFFRVGYNAEENALYVALRQYDTAIDAAYRHWS